MKKKNIINTALLVSLLGATIGGSTYALYSMNNKNSLKISSNSISFLSTKVNDSLKTYSNGEMNTSNSFINGGSCSFDDNGNLNISKMTKNDEITFNITIKNTSNYNLKFKLDVNCLDGYDAFSNLDIDTLLESFLNLNPNEEKIVPVKIKCLSNKNITSNAKISFSIKGYQYNADVKDTLLKEINLDEIITATGDKSNLIDLNLSSSNKGFNIFVPKERYIDLDRVSFKVNNAEITGFNINNSKPKVVYNFTSNGLNEEAIDLNCALFVGKDLTNVKLYQLNDGITKIVESINYDKNTGYLLFNTPKLDGKICVEADELTHFIPTSESEVELGNQLIDLLDNLPEESRIVFDDNVSKITVDQPINLTNKNLSIIGLKDKYGFGNTTFDLTEPININEKSNLSIDYVNINSNNDIFNLSDNSTLDIYNGTFNINETNKSLITSKSTILGTPVANIYDGNFITKSNDLEVIKPYLYETNDSSTTMDGKIRVYGGEFTNFNPGESFYKIDNIDYYKSHLTEGNCSYLYNDITSTDKKYGVTYFLVNNFGFFNKKITDYINFNGRNVLSLLNDVWVTPNISNAYSNSFVSLINYIYDSNPSVAMERMHFEFNFQNYTINFALNDDVLKMLNEKNITLTVLPYMKHNFVYEPTFISDVSDLSKPSFNPVIYKKDGSKVYDKAYGIYLDNMYGSMSLVLKMYDNNSIKIVGTNNINSLLKFSDGLNFSYISADLKNNFVQKYPEIFPDFRFGQVQGENDIWMILG